MYFMTLRTWKTYNFISLGKTLLCILESVADICPVFCSMRSIPGHCPTTAYRPLLHLLHQTLLVPDFLGYSHKSVFSLM